MTAAPKETVRIRTIPVRLFSPICPIPKTQSSFVFNYKKIIKMKDFLLVFRTDYNTMPKSSPEELQALTKRWMDWVGGIAAQNKLTDRGNRLYPSGKVLKAGNVIADGPYAEIKES